MRVARENSTARLVVGMRLAMLYAIRLVDGRSAMRLSGGMVGLGVRRRVECVVSGVLEGNTWCEGKHCAVKRKAD